MPLAVPIYSSNQSGLICGYLFDAEGRGQPLELNEAGRWLHEEKPQDDAFVWLHFNAANVSSEKWLQANLDNAEHCFETLREGVRSTRLEVVDQALVAVVNDVVYDFAQRESLQVATLWMSVERHRVISVRMQPLRAIDHLRIAVKAGESFTSPLALVDHLLRD